MTSFNKRDLHVTDRWYSPGNMPWVFATCVRVHYEILGPGNRYRKTQSTYRSCLYGNSSTRVSYGELKSDDRGLSDFGIRADLSVYNLHFVLVASGICSTGTTSVKGSHKGEDKSKSSLVAITVQGRGSSTVCGLVICDTLVEEAWARSRGGVNPPGMSSDGRCVRNRN